MTMRLHPSALPAAAAVQAHALQAYPAEACGLLVAAETSGEPLYIPCRNMDAAPGRAFTMDPADFRDAERRYGRPLALVHSHPDAGAMPSAADRVMCERSLIPWYIVAVHKDGEDVKVVDATCTEPSGYQAPLRGRPFFYGVLDCCTLVYDYYARELGIELPEGIREGDYEDWWQDGLNLYVENFQRADFVVAPTAMREHDVLLMQLDATMPNHAAIYIGNTRILHHRYNSLSRETVYGGFYREITTHVLRHRSML